MADIKVVPIRYNAGRNQNVVVKSRIRLEQNSR